MNTFWALLLCWTAVTGDVCRQIQVPSDEICYGYEYQLQMLATAKNIPVTVLCVNNKEYV